MLKKIWIAFVVSKTNRDMLIKQFVISTKQKIL